MKRSLLILSTLVTAAGAAILNGVVVVCDYVGRYIEPPVPFTLTAPTPERRDLVEHGMPQQATPRATVTRTERDQRPTLRMFTLSRNDFAF